MQLSFKTWVAVVGVVAGVATIFGPVGSLIYDFAARDIRTGVVENRLSSLEVTTERNASALAQLPNRLSTNESATADLQKQERLFVDKMNAISANLAGLNGKVTSLENQIAELSTKLHAASPIQDKCVELAEQANTGIRSDVMGSMSGKDVIKSALAAMQQLGCSSRGIGR